VQTSSSSTSHLIYQKFRYFVHCILLSVRLYPPVGGQDMAIILQVFNGNLSTVPGRNSGNSVRKGYQKRGMALHGFRQSSTSKRIQNKGRTAQCFRHNAPFGLSGSLETLTTQCIWTQVVLCVLERSWYILLITKTYVKETAVIHSEDVVIKYK